MSQFIRTIVGEAPASRDEFSWLHEYFVTSSPNKVVAKVNLVEYPSAGGLSALMKKFEVSFEDSSVETYVYKTVLDRTERSKQLGGAREAFFYEYLAPTLVLAGVSLPKVVYAYGNLENGAKALVLEDLTSECIQAGYFFGPSSPLNWGKDLDALISKSNSNLQEFSLREVALKTFVTAAKVHATYWQDPALLQLNWLRGKLWVEHKGFEAWHMAQKTAENYWTATKERIASGSSTVRWSPDLVAIVNASFEKTSWDRFQTELASRQWTLVHGDFHPANTMWRWGGRDGLGGSPVLLDWEMVGVGSGPQDLAQYLISHATPSVRREHEEALVGEYYACLTGSGEYGQCRSGHKARRVVDAAQYSWEMCWSDYVRGGSERWVWLLAALSGMCPDAMTQYFHDQLYAFVVDHGVTADSISMPRV